MSDRSDTPAERSAPRGIVCAGCGCFCDDLSPEYAVSTSLSNRGKSEAERDALREEILEHALASARGHRITCGAGVVWFATRGQPNLQVCRNGDPVDDVESACEQAAELLRAADAPSIEGWRQLTIEAQLAAVRIAEALEAPVDTGFAAPAAQPAIAPELTASLDVVRADADLVIFWRGDPFSPGQCPRLIERVVSPPLQDGKVRRVVFLVDHDRAEALKHAREYVESASNEPGVLPTVHSLPPDRGYQGQLEVDLTLALALRGALDGRPEIAQREAKQLRLPTSLVDRLAAEIRKARRTHVFVGWDSATRQLLETLYTLGASRHGKAGFSVSRLPEGDNGRGAEEVLGWRIGTSTVGAFGSEGASRQREERSAVGRRDRRCCDLLVVAGSETGKDSEHLKFAAECLGVSLDELLGADPDVPPPRRLHFGCEVDPGAELSFVAPRFHPQYRARVMRGDGAILWLSGSPDHGIADPIATVLERIADLLDGEKGAS